jgi:hypothetical protein
MSIERIKELEAAIEKAIERLKPVYGLHIRTVEAYNILMFTASLAAPKPAPVTCPVCGKALIRDYGCGRASWMCQGVHCSWTQPDAEQRPKRPEPREGYHAGEFRVPAIGEKYYTLEDGMIVLKTNGDRNGCRWIAVKDVPAFVETAVGEFQPVPGPESEFTYASKQATNCAVCGNRKHTPLRNDTMGGYVCLTCISIELERLQALDVPAAIPPSPVPEPVPVVPVVRYWRHVTLDSELCKTVGERITESIPANRMHIGQEIIDTAWLKISPAEYAAAKSPDHVRGVTKTIEPLGNYPDMKQMRDKMNEVVAWSSVVTKWMQARREKAGEGE